MNLVEQRTPRRPGLYGLAVVALVVLAAAVVALSGGDGGKRKSRSPSKSDGTQTTGKTGPEAATLTADNVKFSDVYGAQIPSSSAGPKETAGGRALGFDRSPAGAVLAAINILARSESRPGPAIFEPTIKEQVVGPDRDQLLANVQQSYAERVAQGTVPDANGVLSAAVENTRNNQSAFWAYRVDAYDTSSVALNLLLRSISAGTPVYVNFAFTVTWRDGDWRLVAPLNGEFSGTGQQMSDVPTAYVVLGRG